MAYGREGWLERESLKEANLSAAALEPTDSLCSAWRLVCAESIEHYAIWALGPGSKGRPGRDRTRLSLKFYPYTERGDGFTVVYAYYSKN